MLGKLLFTALVIGIVIALARERRTDSAGEQAGEESAGASWIPWPKVLAFGAVLIVLSAGAATYYSYWSAANEVVKVRVINSNTGEVAVYQARRKHIDSQRFTTIDHREVTVSDVERIEIVELPS